LKEIGNFTYKAGKNGKFRVSGKVMWKFSNFWDCFQM